MKALLVTPGLVDAPALGATPAGVAPAAETLEGQAVRDEGAIRRLE